MLRLCDNKTWTQLILESFERCAEGYSQQLVIRQELAGDMRVWKGPGNCIIIGETPVVVWYTPQTR